MQNPTRRDALQLAAAGLAWTIAWPEHVLAADKQLPRFRFHIVSDTHLGRKKSTAPAKQWKQAVEAVEADKGDFVLHLGDIVDSGQVEQYPIYKEIRTGLDSPIHEIPGNHDVKEAFAKHLRDPIDFAFDHQRVRFLLLDNSRRDSHDGFLEKKQLDWMTKQLASAKSKGLFVIICMHVPAHTNRHPDRAWYVKPKHGQTALYELITRHKDRVLAMFHGHFHNGIRGWNDNAQVHEVLMPSVLYNLDRGLEKKKAPGYNLAEFRPGFVAVEFSDKGMTLAYRPLAEKKASVSKKCELPQFEGD